MRDPEPGTAGEPVSTGDREAVWADFWVGRRIEGLPVWGTAPSTKAWADAAERWLATQPRYFHRRGPADRRPAIAAGFLAALLAFAAGFTLRAALDRLPR